MHSLAQALAWLDAHDIVWSIVILFVGTLLVSALAWLLESAVWRLAHRDELREEREMTERVERLRGEV